MKVAISQSNYLPWQGYFELVNNVDIFVFLDDVQYTERDWRNRNVIKGRESSEWLTIPVKKPQGRSSLIKDIEISDFKWPETHKKKILHTYKRSINYEPISNWLFSKFDEIANLKKLSEINTYLIREISEKLGIQTSFYNSDSFPRQDEKSHRLLKICEALGAKTYISGPAAQSYLDVALFKNKGIDVVWMNYTPHEYQQLSDTFDPHVSIIDLMFNSDFKFTYCKR